MFSFIFRIVERSSQALKHLDGRRCALLVSGSLVLSVAAGAAAGGSHSLAPSSQGQKHSLAGVRLANGFPTPTPEPTNTPEPTPTATPTGRPTPTPTGSPSPTPTPDPTNTPVPTNTPPPTPTPKPTNTPTPTPKPTPGITPPEPLRLCAGGITGDDVHSTVVQFHASSQGSNLSNTPLLFSFEGNRGHDFGDGRPLKKAKLHDPDQPDGSWEETLTKSTDSQGNVRVAVLSSDVICRMRLVVKWKNEKGDEVEVGSLACDFAVATSVRGFPNQYDPDEPFPTGDTGWLFNKTWLRPSATTTAKIYMKFKIHLDEGDEPSNWKIVNGHQMLFKIDSVELKNGGTATESRKIEYATLTSNRPNGDTVKTTAVDGAASVVVQARRSIMDAQTIYFAAEDQSQWSE